MNRQIYIVLVTAAVSVAATRYYWPAVRTQTVVEEREVLKKDIHTVIKEVIRKDGTKETVTEVIDKSKLDSSSSHTVTQARANWQAGLTVKADFDNLKVPAYGVQVAYRAFGPAWIGLGVSTDKQVMATVSLEF